MGLSLLDAVSFASVGFFVCVAVVQGYFLRKTLRAVADRVQRTRRDVETDGGHYVLQAAAFWTVELAALFLVAGLNLRSNLGSIWPTNQIWIPWTLGGALHLAWVSEFVAMTVKLRTHGATPRVAPRLTSVMFRDIRVPCRVAFSVTAAVLCAGWVGMLALSVLRTEDVNFCESQALSVGVLAPIVALALLVFLLSSLAQVLVWDGYIGYTFYNGRQRRVDMVSFSSFLILAEALPALCVLGIAYALVAKKRLNGCHVIGRKVGVLGSLLAVVPLMKAVRQLLLGNLDIDVEDRVDEETFMDGSPRFASRSNSTIQSGGTAPQTPALSELGVSDLDVPSRGPSGNLADIHHAGADSENLYP